MSGPISNDGRIIQNLTSGRFKSSDFVDVTKEYYIPLENGVVVVRTEGQANTPRPNGEFCVLWITEPGISPFYALPQDIILMKN